GFFPADPHPGNIIIRAQRFVYIAFGLFGELSESNRKKLLKILEAIVLEDVDSLMNLLLQMAIVKKRVNRYVLYEDLEVFFYQYISKELANIHIADFFTDVLAVAHKHGLVMPNDFIMLGKSLTVVEGIVSDFDTEVNVMEIAKSYLEEQEDFSLLQTIQSGDIKLKALRLLLDSVELPSSLKKSLETFSQGRTKLNLEILDWEEKSTAVNKMVNRIVFAIIIAALILASALITVSTTSPGLTSLSVITFIGAGIMGLWLLISIIRSGTL
ncbi:MAG: AarF/UbiB family protein, partial [Tetragenococcus koreensis]|nr:AarF/UbiB family protein [Tetragenococcus koreensis]